MDASRLTLNLILTLIVLPIVIILTLGIDPADKRSGSDPSRVALVFWPSCRLDSVLAMRPLLPLLAEEG